MERQIKAKGIKDRRVLEAVEKVKQHIFVPADYLRLAYEDYPLTDKEKVLAIGSGS